MSSSVSNKTHHHRQVSSSDVGRVQIGKILPPKESGKTPRPSVSASDSIIEPIRSAKHLVHASKKVQTTALKVVFALVLIGAMIGAGFGINSLFNLSSNLFFAPAIGGTLALAYCIYRKMIGRSLGLPSSINKENIFARNGIDKIDLAVAGFVIFATLASIIGSEIPNLIASGNYTPFYIAGLALFVPSILGLSIWKRNKEVREEEGSAKSDESSETSDSAKVESESKVRKEEAEKESAAQVESEPGKKIRPPDEVRRKHHKAKKQIKA